jgi:cell division protein ZapA
MFAMPDVTFSIGGRAYTLRCAAGQEDHLRQIAAAFDRRVQPIAAAMPGADDRHLLVIAGIAVLDELVALGKGPAEKSTGAAVEFDTLRTENQRLHAEAEARTREIAALRQWADSMSNRLTSLSQSLGALAEDASDD